MLSLVSLLLAVVGAEIGLRTLGVGPFNPDEIRERYVGAIRIEPGGKLLEADPLLGFVNAGARSKVTFSDLQFTVTHDAHHHRITRPVEEDASRGERLAVPEVWVSGCSFTHGFGVNDEETFSYLLQESTPAVAITNLGIESGNNVQGYLACKQMAEQGRKPALVIVAYAGFHEIRNVSLRLRRKELSPVNPFMSDVQMPFAKLEGDGKLMIYMDGLRFVEWPGQRWSALVNLLDDVWINLELEQSRRAEVTRGVLELMSRWCDEQGARFLVAGVWPDAADGLDWCRGNGIETIDISFDSGDASFLTNSKVDRHPGVKGHQHYADKLRPKILEMLDVK
jgi:hypothetical protein